MKADEQQINLLDFRIEQLSILAVEKFSYLYELLCKTLTQG